MGPNLPLLLKDAGAAHHRAFAATNGEDPAWAAWYAHWLLPRLGGQLDTSEADLAAALVALDIEHRQDAESQPWPEYYAQRLLERFARRK